MNTTRVESTVIGPHTPIDFITENLDDVRYEQIEGAVLQGKFKVNGGTYNDPTEIIDFKVGDRVSILLRDKLDNHDYEVLLNLVQPPYLYHSSTVWSTTAEWLIKNQKKVVLISLSLLALAFLGVVTKGSSNTGITLIPKEHENNYESEAISTENTSDGLSNVDTITHTEDNLRIVLEVPNDAIVNKNISHKLSENASRISILGEEQSRVSTEITDGAVIHLILGKYSEAFGEFVNSENEDSVKSTYEIYRKEASFVELPSIGLEGGLEALRYQKLSPVLTDMQKDVERYFVDLGQNNFLYFEVLTVGDNRKNYSLIVEEIVKSINIVTTNYNEGENVE